MNPLKKFVVRMATKIAGQHPQDPVVAAWWASLFADDDTGINVTPDTAMRLSGVFGAVTLISQIFCTLPHQVFKHVDGGSMKDPSHPLWKILMVKPNRFQTPKEFKEMQQNCVLLRGNAYAEIIATGGIAVSEVIPLHPDKVRVFRAPDGRRAFEHTDDNGQTRILLQDEIWHKMGPSLDGLSGLSVIEYHARTIGTSIASEKHKARFFKNDATPGIIVTHPNKFSAEAQQNFREGWEDRHRGAERSHRLGILQEGMTIHEIGLTHRDSQYLELLKFGIADIARIFHVPLHMLAEVDRATFSNIEELNQEFITYTLMYWLKTWEESAQRDLFTSSSQVTHFSRFNVDALLRGNILDRYRAHFIATGVPWKTQNEVREVEDMLPVDDGNTIFNPLNMQEAGAPVAES